MCHMSDQEKGGAKGGICEWRYIGLKIRDHKQKVREGECASGPVHEDESDLENTVAVNRALWKEARAERPGRGDARGERGRSTARNDENFTSPEWTRGTG
eukprot:5990528-Pleurochrysis_carterae.AAC.1